ncbi:MAG: phosphatase PAP2 family protein [Lachnospiraceae bacterium]|nr:phosphatase PAP2 family protein [Lachnospiraceae bacterium]
MEFLKLLESIRTPFGDTLFYILTYFGEEMTFLAILCILYWCVDKKLAYRVTFAYMTSAVAVNGLKVSCRIERPWVRDPSFTAVERAKGSATGYSFPSGHTQNSVAMFGTFAYKARKLWQKILLFLIIPVVMFTRMYLGVHTPADVLVSFAVSAVIVLAVNILADKIELNRRRRLIISCILVAMGIIYTLYSMILLNNGTVSYANAADGFKGIGAGLAFAICWYIETVYIDFDTKCKNIPMQLLKIAIGVAGVMLIRTGIKSVFGSNPVADFCRYFLMLCWAMLAMPLIIRRFFAPAGKAPKTPSSVDGDPA